MYSFTVSSGRITISDVGHPKNFQFAVCNIPAATGQWNCRTEVEDCGVYGNRTKKLVLQHVNAVEPSEFIDLPELCIDYGVTVICDSAEYEVEEIDSKPFLFELKQNKIYSSTGFGAEVCDVKRNTDAIANYIEITCFENLNRIIEIANDSSLNDQERYEMILTRHITYYMMGTMLK